MVKLQPKEFRVVGQICREGMDESGTLPKCTICNDRISLPGVAGCLGGGAISPQWVQGAEVPAILQYTVPKNAPKNSLSWYILSVCCIQIERKNSFKLKKFMYKANNSTSCSHGNTKAQTA